MSCWDGEAEYFAHHYKSNINMDTTKRTYLIDTLKESETNLLAVIEKVDEAGFLSKPNENTWSMAELVEHLIITDTGLLQSIKKKGEHIRETTPETVSDEIILKVIPKRDRKVTAPDFLVPKGRFKSKAEAIQAFRHTRATIENFVATTDLPLEKIAFKHFLLGLVNGEGWIVFMAGHCQRHTKQMEEMVGLV